MVALAEHAVGAGVRLGVGAADCEPAQAAVNRAAAIAGTARRLYVRVIRIQ